MLTMLAAMLAAPVSYCEPGLIHAVVHVSLTHQWLTSSFNPWRSPVGGFEKPSDGSSDVFLCSCESLLSLSLWPSLLANDVGDSLLRIVVFIALRVYGSASFSVFLLFLGHWLYFYLDAAHCNELYINTVHFCHTHTHTTNTHMRARTHTHTHTTNTHMRARAHAHAHTHTHTHTHTRSNYKFSTKLRLSNTWGHKAPEAGSGMLCNQVQSSHRFVLEDIPWKLNLTKLKRRVVEH